MMWVAMTATWRTTGHGSEPAGRGRTGRLARDLALQSLVQAKLELEWSPEQIAAWLRQTYPDRRAWHICHETIYQAIYHGGNRGPTRKLTAKRRTGRPLRKRRRKLAERATRFVAQGCLIDQRPLIVEERSRVGDWEGDLIVGCASRSALGTLVDRRSRCLRLIRLPVGHGAEAFAAAAAAVLAELSPEARMTLTWDQGSDMPRHDLLARLLVEGVFFAHPASP